MSTVQADREIIRPIRSRAMATIVVAAGATGPVSVNFEDRYPAGPSTTRSIGPVGQGSYMVDLGLNVWRERNLRITASVAGADASLRDEGEGRLVIADGAAEIRFLAG